MADRASPAKQPRLEISHGHSQQRNEPASVCAFRVISGPATYLQCSRPAMVDNQFCLFHHQEQAAQMQTGDFFDIAPTEERFRLTDADPLECDEPDEADEDATRTVLNRCQFVKEQRDQNGTIFKQCEKASRPHGPCCRVHRRAEETLTFCKFKENTARCDAPIPVGRERCIHHDPVLTPVPTFPEPQPFIRIDDRLKAALKQIYDTEEYACSICGILSEDIESWEVDEMKSKMSLLKKSSSLAHVPEEEFQYPAAGKDFDGCVFESRGFILTENKVSGFYVCEACGSALMKEKVPNFALANGNWTCSSLPAPLKGLNWIEEKMIALSHVSMNIIKCRRMEKVQAWSQQFVKGNCYTYPALPSCTVQSLPLSPRDLNALVKVVFSAKNRLTKEECNRYRFFIVRKAKIRDALHWLIEHNPEYKQVSIDFDTLQHLPEDGIPEEVYQMLTINKNVAEDAAMHSRPSDNNGDAVDAVDDTATQEDALLDRNPDDITTSNRRSYENINERLTTTEMTFDAYGAVDCEGNLLASDLKLLSAFSNANKEDDFFQSNDPSLPIRNGTEDLVYIPRADNNFESEYSPSHLLKAFPTLFPYGVGGIENRNYEGRVRYLLQQSSRLFARHVSFSFVVFNVIQKKKICGAAKVFCETTRASTIAEQIRGINFADLIQKLNKKSQRLPSRLNDLGEPILNSLAMEVNTVTRNIIGSRSFMETRRHEVTSLITFYGVPSLWITINPNPGNHFLMLKYCGIDIANYLSLNDIERKVMMNKALAQDAVAQAKFFDTLMRTLFDILIGIKNSPVGIFGKVNTHYMMVEAQGCGNLHGHGLVWLSDVLNPIEFYDALKDETYRKKFETWIDTYIIKGFDHIFGDSVETASIQAVRSSKTDLLQVNHEQSKDTDKLTHDDILRLAREVAILCNYHHHTATCYKKSKRQKICRFFFGKEGKRLEELTKVDMNRLELIIRRTHAWANSFNPYFSRFILSNNDIKFLPADAYHSFAIVFYITAYQTKCPDETSDFVVFSAALNHVQMLISQLDENSNADELDRVRRLLIKIGYLKEASKMFSASQVNMSLLNLGGKGVYYCNDRFVWLYYGALYRQVSEENQQQSKEFQALTSSSDRFSLIKAYMYRDSMLEALSLYQFASQCEVIRGQVPRPDTTQHGSAINPSGPKTLQRYALQDGHPQATAICIRERSKTVVPIPIGPTIPHIENDEVDKKMKRQKCIHLLFRPWRTIEEIRTEPPDSAIAWEDEVNRSIDDSRLSTRSLLSNLLVVTRSKADVAKDIAFNASLQTGRTLLQHDDGDFEEEGEDAEGLDINSVTTKVEDYLLGRNQMEASGNAALLFAADGLRAAQLQGLLLFSLVGTEGEQTQTNRTMETFHPTYDMQTLSTWQETLKTLDSISNTEVPPPGLDYHPPHADEQLSTLNAREFLAAYTLNDEQARVVLLFMDHVRRKQTTGHTDAFAAVMMGEGGTGKSKVIRCINDFFKQVHREDELLVTATTGVAAHNIDGITLHSAIGAKPWSGPGEDSEYRTPAFDLLNRWKSIHYLIIDEISMLSIDFLMNTVDKKLRALKEHDLYGGLSVLFCGDFRQLPPVSGSPLYAGLGSLSAYDEDQTSGVRSNESERETEEDNQTGSDPKEVKKMKLTDKSRKFWATLTDAFVLQVNYRIVDAEYAAFCSRLRAGKVTDDDIKKLNSRILTGNSEVSGRHWINSTLILTRNSLRFAWNRSKTLQQAIALGKPAIISPAHDENCRGQSQDSRINTEDNKFKSLSTWLPLIKDGPLMITKNIAVKSGLSNGSIVTLKDIIPAHDESINLHNNQDPIIKLTKVPTCLIVQTSTSHTINENFPELPPNQIPLFPVRDRVSTQTKPTSTFNRIQFRVTPAYALTDYKTQGQQYSGKILFDFKRGQGKVAPQSTYVMCSRITSWDSMAILRPFDVNIFHIPVDKDLLVAEQKMEKLRQQTLLSQGDLRTALAACTLFQ